MNLFETSMISMNPSSDLYLETFLETILKPLSTLTSSLNGKYWWSGPLETAEQK